MDSPGGKIICLLTHGYQGGPFEMQPLEEPLKKLGLATRLLTLPGHASSIPEFRKTYFADWQAHVFAEYDKAAAEFEKVVLIGYSLGGTLSLGVAAQRRPWGVATISSPVFPVRAWPKQMRDWGLLFLPLLRLVVKELPSRPARPESRAIAPWQGYEGVVHPPQIYSMFKGFTQVRKKLGQVTAPLLAVHDARDRVVNARNALAIVAGVASQRAESEIIRVNENVTSHHTITTHRESRDFVAARVAGFVADICGLPAPEGVCTPCTEL